MNLKDKLEILITEIKDDKLRSHIEVYIRELNIGDYRKSYSQYRNYYDLIFELIDIKLNEFDWEKLSYIFSKNIKLIKIGVKLLNYIIKNEANYEGKLPKYFDEFIDYIILDNVRKESAIKLFDVEHPPINYYLHKFNYISNGEEHYEITLYHVNTSNEVIRNLLIEFINITVWKSESKKKFISLFEESLCGAKMLSLSDFNAKLFDIQFKYYMEKDDKKLTEMLVAFYLQLLLQHKNEVSIKIEDGIDENLLKRYDFEKLYRNNYKSVFYNPYEKVPDEDKWLLIPNGYEYKTTTLNANTYKKVDFTIIKDIKLRKLIKKLFWEKNVVITSKIKILRALRIYSDFILDYRKNSIAKKRLELNNTLFYITQEEAYSYYIYLSGMNLDVSTKNIYLHSLREFIKFVQNMENVYIEAGVLYYLEGSKAQKKTKTQIIEEDHMIKIFKKFQENSKESHLNLLYLYVLHLSMHTEFRISQIVNLEIDCVKSAMKEDQYVIESIFKQSNGEKKTQAISKITKDNIDKLIEYSKDIRLKCNDDYLKKFLFLYESTTNLGYIIMTAQKFNLYLKKICKELGIKHYSHKNIRNTYITTTKKLGIINDWNKLEILKLTNHKSIDIQDRHYVDIKIQECIEATYGIIIGNVDVNGKVLEHIDKSNSKENIVDDGCGRCNGSNCNNRSDLDCPMCNSFIVTVDRIPYFEEKIERLKEKLIKTEIEHEKDHIKNIIRLYLEYLKRLYIIKNKMEQE